MYPSHTTTRQWIIAVVAMALVAFLVEMERRAFDYHRRAYEHYVRAGRRMRWEVRELQSSGIQEYHIKMMRKWLDAQRHPWRFVEPDPPPPEPGP